MEDFRLRYLQSLSLQFPNINACITEIINLEAILLMPKGTEHYISDVHGEYEQFNHVIKNGSGSVKRKVTEVFGEEFDQRQINRLSTLIYYPEEKIQLLLEEMPDEVEFYTRYINYLIRVAKEVSSKYTRSKVRKQLPKDFSYIMEELLSEKLSYENQDQYYEQIVSSIIEVGAAKNIIISFCKLIQKLVVDYLHIVGDIYDRGEGASKIMDMIINYQNIDIQWGNHDLIWMTAATGDYLGVAEVIRNSIKYGTTDTLEDDYGISLTPLLLFAYDQYNYSDCSCFKIKSVKTTGIEADALRKMHKAIAIIDMKLKAQMALRSPDLHLEDRMLLDKINYETKTVRIDGKDWKMKDLDFPTVDPDDPYTLTKAEKILIKRLSSSFRTSEKLQAHMKFLLKKGSMYKMFDHTLIYHGCIPMNKDKTLREVSVLGKKLKGKKLLDELDRIVRLSFYSTDKMERLAYQDIMCWMWLSPDSPEFGKTKFAIFENYFLDEKEPKIEIKDPYYSLVNDEEAVLNIFSEFGLDKKLGHIVNGHVPVITKKGEIPIKCGGKLLFIDGGFAKAYHEKTGIAGYTLVYNSHGLRLVSHKLFKSKMDSIINEEDIYSDTIEIVTFKDRILIRDTDKGRSISEQIRIIKTLLEAYKTGLISEKN